MTGYTPIYNLPYPQSSDLVSAYPATGQDLAEEVETVLAAKAASTSIGLQYITKADMSAAASVTINSCFTSTYDVYRLLFVSSFSADCNPYIQFRASGTDTTSGYSARRSDLGGTYSSVTLGTGIYLGVGRNGIKTAWTFDIGSPNTASPTNLIGISEDGGAASIAAGRQTGSTQFDGFTITGGANMTGSVYVFAYRKS